jgi:type I restriction enzyme M protein
VVSDEACKDLVRHFSRYRLRNEDFQFSDLLGSAYKFLINMFAESAGKKGGDFYTPRDVIRLMVRMLDPTPGMSIYDPTCGSGGMLIISREYIEQSGGDATNLRLCGQVNDASAWSICKLNMVLHATHMNADIRLADTLLHPMHREAGELERFDRVIANPPFSQNYTKTNMEFPERFRWGWCPTSGKKGDLMFAQHMLAVCKPRGRVATVMPHGVLFRGGAEKEIRRKLLQQDLIEAIIGLPPNLFYGAGIPACILVMRPNLTGHSPNPNKPENRRGQVFFINADAEYYAGRAQNFLRPEHIEKIASTFERFEDVPGYARRVSLAEIADPGNDFNLNIRRYVDNSPPPEPHDVGAHLLGGVPTGEIEAQRLLFDALGFDPAHAFTPREADPRYHDFSTAIADRSTIRPLVENDPGVQFQIETVESARAAWWAAQAPLLGDLPQRRDLNTVRARFLDSFTQALLPLGVLDHFKLAGVIAAWWNDTLPDFKTLMENGFCGVLDGWIDAIADAVEDDDSVGPAFDPFAHKLVRHTMADYLQRIADAKADIARLKGEKEAFEQSNPPDDAEEEELAGWNYAKDLERQIKELKTEHKETLKELAKLERAAARDFPPTSRRGRKKTNVAESDALRLPSLDGRGWGRVKETERHPHQASLIEGEEHMASLSPETVGAVAKLTELRIALQPIFGQLAGLEAELAPYDEIKTELTGARSRYRELSNAFVDELKQRCAAMSDEEKQALVLELFAQDVQAGLSAAVNDKWQLLVSFIESLWDKYRVTLAELRQDRVAVEGSFAEMVMKLGYR